MSFVYLDSSDSFLVIMESIIMISLGGSVLFANKIRTRYPKLTKKGWGEILVGLISIFVHSIFDTLDTLKWSIDGLRDWLNVFDGLFFVIGLTLVCFGILKIARYGAEAWS